MARVLIIEDDSCIQQLVSFNLEKEGFSVLVAGDGKTGLRLASDLQPDLIILDLMLPELDGWEVCKLLRGDEATKTIPIIILSARSELSDKILGLEHGADDYMVKPFSPKELVARIHARLRENSRSPKVQKSGIQWGDLEVFPDNYTALLAGAPLSLTIKEFEMLHIFVSNPNRVFSREHLLQRVWGYDTTWDTRTVDVHVSNLRQKLQTMGKAVVTVRGIGYRFTPPANPKN